MLCSTLSDYTYNDWLHISPINQDSCNEENDVPKLSLNYIYSLTKDDDANNVLPNRRSISVFPPSHSTPKNLGNTLMHLLSPLTLTPADVFGSSNSSPSPDPRRILSPVHLGTTNCLQDIQFDDCYRLLTPLVSSDSYISPIVRASSLGTVDNLPPCTSENPGIFSSPENGSFLDRLRASVHSASSPDRIQAFYPKPYCLLSPCNPSTNRCRPPLPVTPKRQILRGFSSASNTMEPFSPLTPLPEDASYFQGSNTPNTKTNVKRRLTLQNFLSPRPAKARRILRSSQYEPEQIVTRRSPTPELPSRSRSPAPQPMCTPIFTNRTFPKFVPISSDFPMFYRRFPASSYLQGVSTE
ncbi:hypothetical protein BDZ94DRAFT_1313603 [Collybia nuda]|uniref:Uncharacterized protein n=1 Tax=Collybia nuda TaxID=64659 RepID=A0A9P5XYM9_9AGAR|nr:hypothetical protein BDZ94DRAFT_1313603 [Collybia nuda]